MSNELKNLKAYLLCRYAHQSSLYNSWCNELPCESQLVIDNPSDWRLPDDAGIVITHEHFRWEEVSALRKICDQSRIPTLVLADGILEYRNTWQNPTIPDASIYQPLLADKIACIGNNSARMIESWGNAGKVEVVGLPRLDLLRDAQRNPRPTDEFRLLIGTATTPAFTPQQRATVVRSLQAIKSWANANPTVAGRKLRMHWRLTDGLSEEIGIDGPESELSLHDELLSVDAAITTPSTIFLESLLAQVPTAMLDFSNSPPFVPAAWSISAAEHLDTVVEELAAPPEPKMLFQNFVLADNLNCQSSATSRMVQLVTQMMQIGQQCRLQHQPLVFPTRILDHIQNSDQPLVLSKLHPDNPAFEIDDKQRLQAELSQAVARLDTLPRELADKNNQISQLQIALDESRRRLADVRSRLFKLRKILGIGKENQTEELPEKTE